MGSFPLYLSWCNDERRVEKRRPRLHCSRSPLYTRVPSPARPARSVGLQLALQQRRDLALDLLGGREALERDLLLDAALCGSGRGGGSASGSSEGGWACATVCRRGAARRRRRRAAADRLARLTPHRSAARRRRPAARSPLPASRPSPISRVGKERERERDAPKRTKPRAGVPCASRMRMGRSGLACLTAG